jgi:hypothetical protein
MLEDAGVETPAVQHDAPPVRPLRVREMQTKLHRWAAADLAAASMICTTWCATIPSPAWRDEVGLAA